MNLKARFNAWLDASVGNRLMLASVVTALSLVLLLGITAFPLFYYQAWKTFQSHSRHHLDRIADSFEFRLDSAQKNLAQLAKNSFVVNSFVDSTGREVYLQPTLRDFSLPFEARSKLVLFDANLVPFAGSTPDHAALGQALQSLAGEVLRSEKPRLAVHGEGSGKYFALAFPIYYPPAAAYEGVLIALVDAEAFIRLPRGFLDEKDCVSVASSAGVLLTVNCDPNTSWNVFERPLVKDNALAHSLGLKISYGEILGHLVTQFLAVFFAYVLLGAGAVAVAIMLSRRASRLFAGQLESLSSASRALAENPNASARVVWGRPDEIGRFADSFNAMVARLQDFQVSLETRVMERTQELATARDLADAANRAKSTFLANMSHELRTPMNAIIGLTDMARRRVTDPTQGEQLGKVLGASEHLLAIINDVLDISRIEADRLSLKQTAFKLGGVLENLNSLVGQRVQDEGLALVLDLPSRLAGLPVQGDPLRLGQVLINLVGNAIKFSAQGTITVRVRLAEENPEDVLVRFEVQDNGIGISAEDQSRIFKAFEQADGSNTRKYGGAGLGLAISKCLCHMMGGEIGVDSHPGVGSLFWFTVRLTKCIELPQAEPVHPVRAAEEQIRTRFPGARILLVEDEPFNQEVSAWFLKEAGLAVELAQDGIEAVELARERDYDLILMDMQMPRMNGMDATRAIRGFPQHERTPIVALTANAYEKDRQVCLAAGMNDHLGKPVEPDLLYKTLLKWLSLPK